MALLPTLLLLVAGGGTAQAHEVSLQAATFGAGGDADYDLFSPGLAVGSWGVGGGVSLTRIFSVVGGYQRAHSGMEVYAEYEDGDGWQEELLYATSLSSHRAALGVKASWPVRSWVSPYATLQGVGWWATARFDDDPTRDDNLNQLSYAGFAPGGQALLGVQLKPLRLGGEARLSLHVEGGYGLMAPMRFEDPDNRAAGQPEAGVPLGDLRFSGFVGGLGLGVAF